MDNVIVVSANSETEEFGALNSISEFHQIPDGNDGVDLNSRNVQKFQILACARMYSLKLNFLIIKRHMRVRETNLYTYSKIFYC